jgi:hypothetical protein
MILKESGRDREGTPWVLLVQGLPRFSMGTFCENIFSSSNRLFLTHNKKQKVEEITHLFFSSLFFSILTI